MNPLFDTRLTHGVPDVPLVVAHRGASHYATENSVSAAEMAISQGADMIEIDIRRTADGVLVAYHHALLDGYPLHELPYRVVHEVMPEIATLDELLRVTAGRALMDVELKEEGYEADVLEMLARYFPIDGVIVTSFSAGAIMNVKELEPSMQTGWIVKGPQGADVLTHYAWTGADWLVGEAVSLTPDLIGAIQEAGIPLAVWTVNLWSEIDAMLRLPGLAAVITDLPDVARALCDRHAGEYVERVASQ